MMIASQTQSRQEQNSAVKEAVVDLLNPLLHDIAKPINNMCSVQPELWDAMKNGDLQLGLDLLTFYFASVEALKDISYRIEKGARRLKKHGDYEKEAISMYEFFRKLDNLFRPTLQGKNARLSRNIDKDFPLIINTDSTYLLRILMNLIDNSLKHSLDDVLIELQAMVISASKYSIRIVDNGPGLPAELRPDGQGLTIVKELIMLMEGTIETISTEKGTLHTLIFPLDIWIP